MTEAVQQLGLRQVLQIKEVRRLWMAQLVSVFGDFLVIFAVLSHASFDLRATPAQITLIIVFFLVPYALISPVVGVFVDRWNFKRTMIASDVVRAALVLLLVSSDNLNWIYAAFLLLSTVSTFFVPAQIVCIRVITPPEGLISANALMQQAMQIVRIITPALAGAMVAWFGAKPCYIIDCISFLISATLIWSLRISGEPAASATNGHTVGAVVADLMAGVKFIFTHAVLRFVILAMAVTVFALSCVGPLIAIYVRDELKSSEFVFGIINSLLGIGMIVATLAISRFAQRRSKGQLILLGLFTMCGGILLMGVLIYVPSAAAGLFNIGLGGDIVLVSGLTIIQAQTPAEMVGRVSGSLWSLMSIAQLPGLVLSGEIAKQIGIANVFSCTAVVLGLIAILGLIRMPQARMERTTATGS
jgi:MFS transporter, DHA3 family, macrolide efflux protein